MDCVIVSLGPEMEASILTVLYLYELGVERIVAKALTEDHAKILDAVGATEVIFPEKDMAIRTALKLSSPNVLDYLALASGISYGLAAIPIALIYARLREIKEGVSVDSMADVFK